MKRIFLIFLFIITFTITSAQSRQEAMRYMNQGDYTSALTILDGLEMLHPDQYKELIEKCKLCRILHSKANKDQLNKDWEGASYIYKQILSHNPNDSFAKKQLAHCNKIVSIYKSDNYNGTTRYDNNSSQHKSSQKVREITYENTEYGYRIKYPYYLTQQGATFVSKEKGITLTFITKIYDSKISNYEILNDRKSHHDSLKNIENDIIIYHAPDPTQRKTSDWCVLSGYQKNKSIVYYEKSYIVTRKNQYGENIKLMVTAYSTALTSSSPAKEGNDIASYFIHKTFFVDKSSSTPIETKESDHMRWLKAKTNGSIEALQEYITTAPKNSIYIPDALSLLSIAKANLATSKAEEYFNDRKFFAARKEYENAKSTLGFLGANENVHYHETLYQCSLMGMCDIDTIQGLISYYHNDILHIHKLFTLRGCIIKKLCACYQFDRAREYVKLYGNKGIWLNEKPYKKAQWRKYIKQQEQNTRYKSNT